MSREDIKEERVRMLEEKMDWAIRELGSKINVRECLKLCKLVKKTAKTIHLIKNSQKSAKK
jgi:hypothetical protein